MTEDPGQKIVERPSPCNRGASCHAQDETLRSLWNRFHDIALLTYPDASPRNRLRRAALMARLACNVARIRSLFREHENAALQETLRARPSLIRAAALPYLHANWSAQRKLAVIRRHYQILSSALPSLRLDESGQLTIARVPDAPGLSLVLDHATWFMSEGEIVLNLFENDTRLYSIAFTVGEDGGKTSGEKSDKKSDERVAYVGALQGYGGDQALDIYRRLTRTLHGMRPRDFLVAAFRLVCVHIDVRAIHGVGETTRVHQNKYHDGHDGVKSNYDEIWRDYGADALPDGFWRLRPAIAYRPAANIPVRKRALYRHRYQMLDELSAQIGASCGSSPG